MPGSYQPYYTETNQQYFIEKKYYADEIGKLDGIIGFLHNYEEKMDKLRQNKIYNKPRTQERFEAFSNERQLKERYKLYTTYVKERLSKFKKDLNTDIREKQNKIEELSAQISELQFDNLEKQNKIRKLQRLKNELKALSNLQTGDQIVNYYEYRKIKLTNEERTITDGLMETRTQQRRNRDAARTNRRPVERTLRNEDELTTKLTEERKQRPEVKEVEERELAPEVAATKKAVFPIFSSAAEKAAANTTKKGKIQ